ncbi:amidohydrolase family protein [bacterium]|nr:MAG: amidohydrolase family protein [bacterium]
MRKSVLAAFLIMFLVTGVVAFGDEPKKDEPVTALVGGTVIDGTGASPIVNATVLVQGAKILAVGPTATVKVPKGANVIDVRGKFVIPGFIDCHTHITSETDQLEYFTDTNSLAALRGLQLMNFYLKSGVTAIRDVGSPIESIQALRKAQEMGYVDTIRLFPCGYLITVTGGHGDGMHGALAVDGPWAFRKAVREMNKEGFRHIKISPTFTLEEARAAVDEAKTLGMHITAHGGGFSDTIPTTMTRIAVQAGVECIEHWNEMEDDVLDLMAQKGVYDVPTLTIYRESYKADDISRFLIEKRHWSQAMHETLFRKARDRKIVMGIGTDAGGQYRKQYPKIYFDEMRYFVELGASPMEAIVAATKNGALVLGMADELGTVEAGKFADLQVLGADPLKSFDALGKPEIVFVNGKAH